MTDRGGPFVLADPDQGFVSARRRDPFAEPDQAGAAAFTGHPRRMGGYSMKGLRTLAEPGTHPIPVPVPTAGGYEAVTGPLGRSSTFARHILPQFGVAINRRLLGIGSARHAWPRKRQRSMKAAELPRGNPDHQMRPQPIFPGRVTGWPRVPLAWPTFGQTGYGEDQD